jgi:hydroxymethylglutaryl-CoA lyase
VRAAKRDGMWVRGYVSTAFGSPFGDVVTPQMVVDVSVKLMDMGCDELSIGDTIGVGVPSQVDELDAAATARRFRSIASRSLSRHARHRAGQRLRSAATTA